MKTNDVMVDLETLGNRAGCQILSIGAVFFSRLEGPVLGTGFYTVCSTRDDAQGRLGLHTNPDTMAWWKKQSPEAQGVLREAKLKKTIQLATALEIFAQYLIANAEDPAKLRVWGNGSDFDNAILYAAFAAVSQQVPWQFWNSRCFRTLKSEFASVPPPVRQGTHHNALDDALYQAQHASEIFKAMQVPATQRRGV